MDVETTPALVQFLSINVTPGTAGERTETLTRIRTVTTTYGGSAEISASGSRFLVNLGFKMGFSVQSSKATTDQETRSMRWTFDPGYYGLYKATRVVTGKHQWGLCKETENGYAWIPSSSNLMHRPKRFTTYANLEEGTVSCADSPPGDSLRALARRQLGC